MRITIIVRCINGCELLIHSFYLEHQKHFWCLYFLFKVIPNLRIRLSDVILSIRIHLYKKDPTRYLSFASLVSHVRKAWGAILVLTLSLPHLCFASHSLSSPLLSEPIRKGIDGFGHSIQGLNLCGSFLSESYLTESMESSAPQRFDIFRVFSRYCGEWGRRTLLSFGCVLRVAFSLLTALIFVFSFVIWRCNLGKSCLLLFLSIIAYWCVKFCLSYFGWIYFLYFVSFFYLFSGQEDCLENQEFNWVLLCWLNRTKREKRWTSVGWLCCWDELCFDLEIFVFITLFWWWYTGPTYQDWGCEISSYIFF